MQQNYDKQYGFNDFPYTHGDEVERAQEEATAKWREELKVELTNKGAIKPEKTAAEIAEFNQEVPNEDKLKEKAKTRVEAKNNDNMLDMQTRSHVLRNQVRVDQVEFKNQKQEALYNQFI